MFSKATLHQRISKISENFNGVLKITLRNPRRQKINLVIQNFHQSANQKWKIILIVRAQKFFSDIRIHQSLLQPTGRQVRLRKRNEFRLFDKNLIQPKSANALKIHLRPLLGINSKFLESFTSFFSAKSSKIVLIDICF